MSSTGVYLRRVNSEHQRPELLRRLDAIPAWALDGALVLFLLVPTAAINRHGIEAKSTAPAAAVAAATLLSTLPLLVRRRWPVHVLVASLIASVAIQNPAPFSPPAVVAVYTVASRRRWRVALTSAIVATLALDVHQLLWGYNLQLNVVYGAALALGLYQKSRLAEFEQTRERAARLERERELLDQQAAAQERMRIARELHDVVAHNVSLMVIQAQALGQTAHDPAACGRAQTIAELGRDAMREMHRTLELMRADGAEEERQPQPALEDLGPLLERTHAAGVNVELSVSGTPRPLPAGMALSAYRILQEALTNVIKHSGSDRAWVELGYGNHELELEIVDHGSSAARRELPPSGHGLLGMRERVALFGGILDAGPRDGCGYRVLATLPYRR
jgi:signal transduction histidine kinase